MAKAVLISIRPEWVEKIANEWKTIEVRKTKPYLETPFKCYIYCTQCKHLAFMQSQTGANLIACMDVATAIPVGSAIGNGKVIGEFVCDKITWLTHIGFSGLPGIRLAAMKNGHTIDDSFDFSESCLTTPQIEKYLGGKDGYAWHISKLKIYDDPKQLNRFKPWSRECKYNDLGFAIPNCGTCQDCIVKKPPQSWCYVEELKTEGAGR